MSHISPIGTTCGTISDFPSYRYIFPLMSNFHARRINYSGTSTISGNMTAYARWQKETTGGIRTPAAIRTEILAITGTVTRTPAPIQIPEGNVNNGAAGNGSNGSTSPDDNLLGNATGKANGADNGKRKLPTMLQQTGVTVSVFAVIGAAIGAVAAIVSAFRKRK